MTKAASTLYLICIALLVSACEVTTETNTSQEMNLTPKNILPNKNRPELDLSLTPYKNKKLEPLSNKHNAETASIIKHLDKEHKAPYKFSGEVLLDTEKVDLIEKVDGGKVDMEIKF